MCFIVRKWRRASIWLKVNWSQPLKLLDERVSIAPQQPLPVLSVSHFLPRKIQSAAVCQPAIGCTSILSLLSPPSQPTTALELCLKETPWLSPLCSAGFLYQAPVRGKNVSELALRLTIKKASVPHRGHCNRLMHQEKMLTLLNQHLAFTKKQMCNRNLMWHDM